MEIEFELTLPKGPKNAIVLVSGGADADRDGTVEDDEEVEAFKRTGNTWKRKQLVSDPTTGMLFGVTLTVGRDVSWKLEIKDATGSVLFSDSNVTTFSSEVVSGMLH